MPELRPLSDTPAPVDHQYLATKIEELREHQIVFLTKLETLPVLVDNVQTLKNDMQNMKTNWESIKDLVEAQALVKTTAKYLRVVGGWAAAIIAIAVVIKNLITGNWPVQ